MAKKEYWIGKNAIQFQAGKDPILPGGEIPGNIDPKVLKEFKEKGLVSDVSPVILRQREVEESGDVSGLKKEIESLKKENASLKKDGDKALKKENEALKSEIETLKKEIEELTAPVEV